MLQALDGGAFQYSGLVEIILPESVTTVGNQAFYNDYLVSATIKGNVSFKGTDVFKCYTPDDPLKSRLCLYAGEECLSTC